MAANDKRLISAADPLVPIPAYKLTDDLLIELSRLVIDSARAAKDADGEIPENIMVMMQVYIAELEERDLGNVRTWQ